MAILPDEIIQSSLQQPNEVASKEISKSQDWGKIATFAIGTVGGFLLPIPTVLLVGITKEIISALSKARECGLTVFPIGRSEANLLVFPPGHPRDRVLYIGHPALPKVYYTAASFHRMAFEHKFSEAIDILMHLGATELRVEHVRGWSREFSNRLSVAIPEVGEVDGNVGKNSKTSAMLLYEAKLDPQTEPQLPDNLVWYHHEPTWQSVAKGRLKFGLKEFSLTVNYEDDFGVNAGLKLSVEKVGLDLGGRFEGHESTTWKLVGKFGEITGRK